MNLDNLDIHVTCDCGHEFTETLATLKSQDGTTCPACGTGIRTSEESVAEAGSKIDAAVDGAIEQLRKAFKNAGFKS